MEKPRASRSDPDARRAYTRWHYQQNQELYKGRAKSGRAKAREEVRELVFDYLKGHPCVDCGEADPIVLEFDHRPGVEKKFAIGDAVRRCLSPKSVRAEIEKCDVRCANCHRRVTYRRASWSYKGFPA